MDYSKYWMIHLRLHSNPFPFPRKVGEPFQSMVSSKDEYVEWVRRHSGRTECYVAVYSEEQKRRGVIDTVLVDVDNVPFGLKLWKYFQYNNIYPRVMYSGKGLHQFIDFDPIKLSRPNDTIRKWASQLPMRDVGLWKKAKASTRKRFAPYIDPAVIGDISRVSRIPYTLNTRVKPYMSFYLPQDVNEAERLIKSYVIREIKEPPRVEVNFGHNNIAVANALLQYDSQPIVNPLVQAPRFNINEKVMMSKKMLEDYPVCIKKYLEDLRDTGELDHYQRLQLVTFLHRVGYDDEAIVNLFREYAHDYNETKTRYQVTYIIKRELKMRGCISAIDLGICCYQTIEECKLLCPYFPSMNWWTVY